MKWNTVTFNSIQRPWNTASGNVGGVLKFYPWQFINIKKCVKPSYQLIFPSLFNIIEICTKPIHRQHWGRRMRDGSLTAYGALLTPAITQIMYGRYWWSLKHWQGSWCPELAQDFLCLLWAWWDLGSIQRRTIVVDPGKQMTWRKLWVPGKGVIWMRLIPLALK